MVAASKVPMLKPGEYEIWRMRIEQYIQMIDYALWKVIENDQVDLANPEGNRVVPDVSKPLLLGGPPCQVDLANPEGNRVVPDVSKPLLLGGPPCQDLEYLLLGDKERRNAISISKLKAAYYPNYGLEELVLSLWIESEYEYDISAAYVNMWIRNIVIRKCVEDLQLGIESYQTKLNLTQPSWDAYDFLFEEDYTIVHKPRALDYMVKDFRLFKFNPGMENRIWSEDNKIRSKEFIEVIERRIKSRRIFRNLESFVSGRLKDVDYRLIQRTE
nr:hypothetical protein [Tanacetum cinerariifolium]